MSSGSTIDDPPGSASSPSRVLSLPRRHGTAGKSRSQSFHGVLPGLTSFHAGPGLRLHHQCSQLVQKRLRRRAGPAKLLDSLEPVENGRCLLHVSTVAVEPSPMGYGSFGDVCQRPRGLSDRGAERRSRREPE